MCVLCERLQNRSDVVMENDTCFAVSEKNPVNFGHVIIATKQCKRDIFELSYKENEDMNMLLRNFKKRIDKQLSPDGYNVGFNCGRWAGQEVMHCHAHLIPRFAGDVPATELSGGIKNFKEPMVTGRK